MPGWAQAPPRVARTARGRTLAGGAGRGVGGGAPGCASGVGSGDRGRASSHATRARVSSEATHTRREARRQARRVRAHVGPRVSALPGQGRRWVGPGVFRVRARSRRSPHACASPLCCALSCVKQLVREECRTWRTMALGVCVRRTPSTGQSRIQVPVRSSAGVAIRCAAMSIRDAGCGWGAMRTRCATGPWSISSSVGSRHAVEVGMSRYSCCPVFPRLCGVRGLWRWVAVSTDWTTPTIGGIVVFTSQAGEPST